MRILIVQPTWDKKGHYGIWTTRMCQEIARLGHQVTLFTNKAQAQKYLDEPAKFHVIEAKNGKYCFEKYDSMTKGQLNYYKGYFRNSFFVTKEAFKYCRKQKFDAVFLTDIEFLTVSFLLKWFAKSLPVVVMHVNAANFTFDTYTGSIFKKGYKVFQREIFKSVIGRQINAIVVLGQWHAEKLRKQLNIGENFPIEVIPDAAEIRPVIIDRRQAREKIGIDYNGKIFLAFGILRKDKGLEQLFKAFSLVKHEEFRLLVAGEPMEYTVEQIQEMIKLGGLEDKVICRFGYIADELVPYYYCAADITVLAYAGSYRGGSGPLMSGSCTFRRPVLATDVSELGRMTNKYQVGLVAQPDNPQDAADKIRRFLIMPQEHYDKMTANADILAKENSWQMLGERYSRLYERLVNS